MSLHPWGAMTRPRQDWVPPWSSREGVRPSRGLPWEDAAWSNRPGLHWHNLLSLFSPSLPCPSLLPTVLQVWFQNRRAKFRRNERAMLANKNASLLKSYSGDVTAVEQPIVPRPAPRPTDYFSWGTASPYR